MLHYFYTLRILTNSQCFQSKKRFKQYKLHFLGIDGITKKCYDIAISCFVIVTNHCISHCHSPIFNYSFVEIKVESIC